MEIYQIRNNNASYESFGIFSEPKQKVTLYVHNVLNILLTNINYTNLKH